jgi:hypothetical protein
MWVEIHQAPWYRSPVGTGSIRHSEVYARFNRTKDAKQILPENISYRPDWNSGIFYLIIYQDFIPGRTVPEGLNVGRNSSGPMV